ncbi:hypothetical protein [Vitiosangium sp. GDMCC 1.1324]|uniref:hypothetical protein n=1 Tax=Vitiosangium sp. (strain GDMCC 1.1324) TaxID=2138576 RepID=UPI000D38C80B|nr:hypothetical protein [Vitiosangium sp. GDMCC 1.1324]PTL84667.1 hypothetical protein DAT35_06270 [Vitiosangium sp. GDMCC 1.1324]
MKKLLMLLTVGTAALVLGGCGGESRMRESPGPRPDFPADAQGQRFELRLKGVNNPGYASALVQVRRVSISTVEGQPLPVRLKARFPMDLTQPEQAHLLGLFLVPEGVDRVRVEVEFDDFGGYEEASGGGVIDTRVAPLRFEAPVAYLAERGHAVVHLDLGQSLRPLGDARLLLPSLDVRY